MTVYPTRFAVDEPTAWDLSWRELVRLCTDEVHREAIEPDEKDNLRLWHGARIRKGGGRRNADVESVSCLFLDIDKGGLVNAIAELEKRGLRAIAFASPSGKKGRGRILVDITRDLTPDEYKLVWTIVNSWLGDVVDQQTRSPSHGFYVPAIVRGRKFWSREIKGRPLDVDELDLTIEPDVAPVMRAPRAEELEELDLPWRRAQVMEYLRELPETVEAGDRHGALYRIAQKCLDFALPEKATREIVLNFNAERCDPPKEEHIVDSAVLANPEKYRRHPVGCEVTVCVRLIETDHARTIRRVVEVLADRMANLYTRGGVLTELIGGTFRGLDGGEKAKARLSTLISQHVRLYRFDKGNPDKGVQPKWVRTSITGTHWLVTELLALPSYEPVREAAGITDIPMLRPDGSVLCEEGYDEATQLVYVGEQMDVPTSPTYEEGLAALEAVEELFSQSPFEDETRRSAFLSLLLTTVARPMIDGPVPIGIINAKASQVGKSALAETIHIVYTGEHLPVTTLPAKHKMEETLHTAMVSEPRIIVFENIENSSKFASAMLDGAVTAMRIWRRRHYSHERWVVDFRPLVLLTGNNLSIGGDTKKRALHIFLHSEVDTSERTDLKIDDFCKYMKEHRLEIVRHLLTVWRAFLVVPEGERGEKPKPWKTFTSWTIVRQLLLWYGRPDPREARADDIDDDTEMQTMLLGYLRKKWPKRKNGFTATDLCSRLDVPKLGGRSFRKLTDEEQQLKSWVEETAGALDARKVGIKVLRKLKDCVHESGWVLQQKEIRLRKRVRRKDGSTVYKIDKTKKGSKVRYFVLSHDEKRSQTEKR